jgi:glycosyltransferase involved in cell wall biosynthesis
MRRETALAGVTGADRAPLNAGSSTHASLVPVPVSVVICARNRGNLIGRCIDSVLQAQPAEIIVVDGNSTDDTADVARAKGIKVISDNGAGLGAARQMGGRHATTEWVIFVDSDVVVDPDTLQLLHEEAVTRSYDALEAELLTLSANPTYWQGAERWRRKVQMRKGLATVLGCQITLVKRDLLLRVGFDPAFKGAAEDADFFYRARAVGAVVAHSEWAVAYHEDRITLPEFVSQKIWHGRGLARMISRYGRSYLANAAGQVDNSIGAARFNLRYLPYMTVSWTCTAIGVGLEMLKISRDESLRAQLRLVEPVRE